MTRLDPNRFWLSLGLFLSVLTIYCDSNHGNTLFRDDDPYIFEAGVYVLTQNALDEAPYRYASFLQDILRRMEKQRMPAKQVGLYISLLMFADVSCIPSFFVPTL